MLSRAHNQGVELDTLEDIFRQKERDVENGILNFSSRDKGLFCMCMCSSSLGTRST